MRRALLIVNRASRACGWGLGPALDVLRETMTLVDAGCAAAIDVSPCIIAHAGAVDCVIVAGGDGSLNAAARGLLQTGLPLGVIPVGTANDFARSLELPLDGAAAARVVVDGCLRRIDIGEVNGFPFFNVASVGLAAEVARRLTTESKRRFGHFSYMLNAARLLLQTRPFHATLIVGAEKIMVRTLQITVGNGRFYGGGNIVASDAHIDDGHLDLYSLEFSTVWRMALMIPSFKHGGHGALRDVRTARGDTFEVITRKPKPVNADGELITATPALFTQRRRAVSVYAPVGPSTVTP